MQWPIEDRLWKVGRVKKVKGIDHKAFARFIPKDWPSRDFFVSSIFFLSLVIFTAQEEKKKRFSCSLVTRQHMRARASVFVARWQAAVEPVGSISLLVEDSTVVVLCFAAKRKKNLTWHWASWSWKGMTSRWPSSKKRTQSSRTVSSLLLLSYEPEVSFSCLVCLSKWRRVTLELFCHRWKLILSTQQQPPRYFCSSVSPVPCKRTPQLPSGIRNTLSIVRGLFLSLDFIISINQFTHHVALVILEKINKNEWCMNGISQQVLKCRYYIYRIGSIVVVNK